MAKFEQQEINVIAKIVDVITADSYRVIGGVGSLAAQNLISGATQGRAYDALLADLEAMSYDNKCDLLQAVEEYNSIRFDDVEVTSVDGIGAVNYSSARHKAAIKDYVKSSLLQYFTFAELEMRRSSGANGAGSMNIDLVR